MSYQKYLTLTNKIKHLYTSQNPVTTRVIFFLGILSWLVILCGYIGLIRQNHLFLIICGVPIIFISLDIILGYILNFFAKPFDTKKHDLKTLYFKLCPQKPSVDLFVPVCGEPLDILERTFESVSKIYYENVKIYVLDDTKNIHIEKLAKKYHLNYLSRPNAGYLKKAGNLNYGINKTNSDYIAIFDADYFVNPSFLVETIHYMRDNPHYGIVQTPQFFEETLDPSKSNSLEYSAAAVQEDFYRFSQTARDTINGGMCVGTNALYRRSSLDKNGGVAKVDHSEDIWTGLKLLQNGYKIKYLPIILAIGNCPTNYVSFFNQQYRWSKGAFDIMFSKGFWIKKISSSSRVSFISTFLYYISKSISYFFPLITIFLLFTQSVDIEFVGLFIFLPYIFFEYFLLPRFRVHNMSIMTIFIGFFLSCTYLLSFMHTLFGHTLEWRPSGRNDVTSKNHWFNFMYNLNLFYFVTVLAFFLYSIVSQKINMLNIAYFPIFGWVCYTLFLIFLYLFLVAKIHKVKPIEDFKSLTNNIAKVPDQLLLSLNQNIANRFSFSHRVGAKVKQTIQSIFL